MQNLPYTNKTITWQAFSVMRTEKECIAKGYYPNGKKMTAHDIQEAKEQIEICKQVLLAHGLDEKGNLLTGQLELWN